MRPNNPVATGAPVAGTELVPPLGMGPGLYNAVLDACELILAYSAAASARSTAITTRHSVRLRLPVASYPPYKVFWSSEGPRIDAVFPHP